MTKEAFRTDRADVNALLRHRNHQPVANDEWRLWREELYLEPSAVADRIVRARLRKGRLDTEDVAPNEPSSLQRWVWALSLIHVDRSVGDARVEAFRASHLPAGLIKPEDIPQWMNAHRQSIDNPRRYALVSIEHDEAKSISDRQIHLQGGTRRVAQLDWPWMLKYPGPRGERFRTTGPGSTLDELRSVSEHLAQRHPWLPSQATAHILTGWTPVVRMLSRRIGPPPDWGGDDTIVIEANTHVPADVVLDAYVDGRRQLVTLKDRLPGDKGLDIVAMKLENPGLSEGQLLRQWNVGNPSRPVADLRALRQALNGTLKILDAQLPLELRCDPARPTTSLG